MGKQATMVEYESDSDSYMDSDDEVRTREQQYEVHHIGILLT